MNEQISPTVNSTKNSKLKYYFFKVLKYGKKKKKKKMSFVVDYQRDDCRQKAAVLRGSSHVQIQIFAVALPKKIKKIARNFRLGAAAWSSNQGLAEIFGAMAYGFSRIHCVLTVEERENQPRRTPIFLTFSCSRGRGQDFDSTRALGSDKFPTLFPQWFHDDSSEMIRSSIRVWDFSCFRFRGIV